MLKNFIFNRYILVVVFSFSIYQLNAQKQYPGVPIFNPEQDTTFVPVVELKIDEEQFAKRKNSSSKHFKVDEFALPVDIEINTEDYGVWLEYKSRNKKVWLLRIQSKNARSLNLLFDKYKLLPGAKVFLYNRSQSIVQGAFTHLNNKSWSSLATSQLYDSEMYIELQVPYFLDNYGDFSIGQVGVEPKNGLLEKSTDDEYFNRSATCHVNINCFIEGNYQRQKRSVCRIIYRGGRRCTGTLINNLSNDGTPYIITAAHCINTDFVANNAVFYFNYESPTCESLDVLIPDESTISGASLVSTVSGLDFVLLRLSEIPALEAEPYYSGWDARGISPQSSYVIHHPQGDVKKISIDENASASSTYGSFDPNTHWLLFDYEVGTSEDGSSGSGLISEDNLLVGTLTGGGDTCVNTILDYYQKFSSSYNDYSDSVNQLKHWLDPDGVNTLTCKPLDASQEFRGSAEIITNIRNNENPEVIKQSNGWGYLSGHNYQSNTLFAEYFELNGSKYLYGANIDIAKSFASDVEQEVVFTIWEGGDEPGKILYEHSVPSADIDVSPYKIDFDSTVLVHRKCYFGYRIAYQADTFAVKTVSTDITENSAYTFINNEWNPLQLNGVEYSSALSLELLAFDYLPQKSVLPDSNTINKVHIYPNPSNLSFQAFFKEAVSGNVELKIYNLQGKVVYIQNEYTPGFNIHVPHNLESGIYILNVFLEGKKYATNKLIVI